MEFNFRTEDIKQRPQVVSFTTEINPVNPDNDYILYGYNDNRWLKHKNIRMDNTFTYLNNDFLSYPTAGWVQVGDADLTYHTEDDLDMGFQENKVQEGNIIWIIQEDNGDWAIRKYLGGYPESLWLNLRYKTIAEMNNIDKEITLHKLAFTVFKISDIKEKSNDWLNDKLIFSFCLQRNRWLMLTLCSLSSGFISDILGVGDIYLQQKP